MPLRPNSGRYSVTSPPYQFETSGGTRPHGGRNSVSAIPYNYTSPSDIEMDRQTSRDQYDQSLPPPPVFVVDNAPHTSHEGHISVFDPLQDGLRRLSITPEYSRLPDQQDQEAGGFDEEDLDGDSLDEDVIEYEDIVAKRECCGEARLNCSRLNTVLHDEGHNLKKACGKIDCRSSLRSFFSLETLKKRLPIIQWAPKYRVVANGCTVCRVLDLQGDLIAGFTVGLTVLPQALAYANLANLPPVYGLYSSFVSSFVYVIFGSAKDITLGPSAISALLAGIYATSPIPKDPNVAIALAFLSGLIEFAMFLFGFGFIMDFISFSVIKSFTVAAAVTIAMSQVKRWWGEVGVPSAFMEQLYYTVKKIPESRLYDFLLGVCCIFIIVLLKKLKELKWKRKYRELSIPLKILKKTLFYLGLGRNIVAIILATIVAYIFFQNGLVPFVLTGYVPPGIPPFKLPEFKSYDPKTNKTYDLNDFTSLIGIGYVLVPVIGLFEAMAIGNVFARRNNYRIDPNQELLAYSIGNILTGCVSGFPVTGTFSRTAVNAQSGVRTPAGGIVTGVIVLLALQFLTPVFYYIPNCSLSCVIIMAVIDMITFHKIWIFWKTNKIDLLPWIVTFVTSFVISIAWGVIIGAALSLVILLYPMARPKIKVMTREAGSLLQSNNNPDTDGSVVVLTFGSGLPYTGIEHCKDILIPIYQRAKLPKGVVLDFAHVSVADTTTVQGMRSLLENFNKRGITVVFCNLQKQVDNLFRKAKPKFFRKAATVAEAVRLVTGEADVTDRIPLTLNTESDMNGKKTRKHQQQPQHESRDEASGGSDDVSKAGAAATDDTFVRKLVQQEAERYINTQHPTEKDRYRNTPTDQHNESHL